VCGWSQVLLPYKNENKKKIAVDHPQEDLAKYFGYRIKRKVNLFFKPCYLLVTCKYQQPRSKYGEFKNKLPQIWSVCAIFSPKNLLYTTLELPLSPLCHVYRNCRFFKTFIRKVIHSLDVKTFQASSLAL
jgi:hypothetical protein